MRKVLIVDDEELIRKGLRVIIERADTCFKDITECSDGKEALEKMTAQKFDLAVLDICMPNMDGITFMKEAQGLSKKPQFIILSGYDEFGYAVESMKYGAKHYLLKPVKREQFIEALKKIEADIEAEEKISSTLEKFDDMVSKIRTNEINYIFMNSNLAKQDILGIFDAIGFDMKNKNYVIGVLIKRGNPGGLSRESTLQLKDEVDQYLSLIQNDAVSILDTNSNIVVIAEKGMDFELLIKDIKKRVQGEYIVGMSEPQSEVTHIIKAYNQACKAAGGRILDSTSQIIHYRDVWRGDGKFRLPIDLIKRIPDLIGTSRIDEVRQVIDDIFNEKAVICHGMDYVEKAVEKINQNVLRHFDDNISNKPDFHAGYSRRLGDISSFESLQHYIAELKEYMEQLNCFLLGMTDRSEISQAIKYITENYNKDINLAMVANYTSLNYSYFSSLFKEHTGLTFVDYLKRMRVEKAKELLKNTSCNIYEIAEQVGYQNVKHFTKTFRLFTGISPKEYRNKAI